MEKQLNPAEQYELKFLRRQVDNLAERRVNLRDHENVVQDYLRSVRELKQFVFKLRQLGREI